MIGMPVSFRFVISAAALFSSALADEKVVLSNEMLSNPELSPSLNPRQDKKFFKKDYPDDLRPAVTGYHEKYQKKYDFTHPYPVVQEDKHYDEDFVSDENNDGGEWRAQEEYDKARIQIAKLKAEVDRLGVKEAEAKAQLEAAQAKEDDAEAASKSAEKRSDEAKKDADKAQDKEDDLLASAKDAEAEVRKEMKQLGDCREELRQAKEALEQRTGKPDDSSSSMHKEEANVEESAAAAEAAETVEEKWEDRLAREKREYEEARKRYEKEAKDVKEVQALLDQAAAKLRRFRAEEVDQDGGVYRVDENGKKIAFHDNSDHKSAAGNSSGGISFAAVVFLAALVSGRQ